jgi:hypothetical protein
MFVPVVFALGISYTFVDIKFLGNRYTDARYGDNETYVEIYHIISKGNSHKITLQTYYDGKWVSVGDTVKIPNGDARQVDIEYIPTDVQYCRISFDFHANCNGPNTTSTICQKDDAQYRIKIQNMALFAKLSVVGWTN